MSPFSLIRDFFVCFGACFFFALLLNAPKKVLFWSAFLGAAGYIIYLFSVEYINTTAGFFFGTLLMAVASEILARKKKLPVTVFVTPAIVSLVPGTGLYYSMLFFVRGDVSGGVDMTVETLINAGAMAIALASTSVGFGIYAKHRSRNMRQTVMSISQAENVKSASTEKSDADSKQ